jgi:hypothetical protein
VVSSKHLLIELLGMFGKATREPKMTLLPFAYLNLLEMTLLQ